MTPLKQKFRHDPAAGVWGDCHRAAVASVLNLPLEAVPHFAEGGPDGEEFFAREKAWLLTQHLVPVRMFFGDPKLTDERNIEQVLALMAARNTGVYYLLGGRSRTSVNHTVVCLDDKIVHDPSLTDSGIIGPCDSGFLEVTLFVAFVATVYGSEPQLVSDYTQGNFSSIS